MIGNIDPKKGTDTVGLALYLFGPGRFNEHTHQRVIACSPTFGILDGTRLHGQRHRLEILQLGRRMDAHRKALGVTKTGGHLWHCSISLPPGETLTDAQWAQVARDIVRGLDFDNDEENGVVPCRWMAVHHGQSRNGNEHLHWWSTWSGRTAPSPRSPMTAPR